VKLRNALLCAECDEVYSSLEHPNGRCPSCGDCAAFPLERAVMDRRARRVTRDRERRVVAVFPCRRIA